MVPNNNDIKQKFHQFKFIDNYGHYNMILEYANEGTLREYLKINFTKLQWTDKLYIAKELAHGLLFLHNKEIIHRDLHSKNILIHQRQPKITDFGLSKQMNENSSTSSSIIHGMPAYIEPKCFIDHKYKRDKRSDVYSLGVILWEISSGRPPFQTFKSRDSLVIHIFQGNREEPIEGTPSQYIELYKKCWDNNPDNRPETSEIFNDIKQLVLNETFDQHDPIDTSSENSEVSLSHQYNINALANSLEITTSSPLYLTDTNNSNTLIRNNSIIGNLRKETIEFFNQPKFLEAFEVLCKNSTLTSLDLRFKNLRTEGGKALADALCNNNTLTSLELCSNKLGSEVGKALADALCKNSTLTSFNLRDNKLGPEGGKALADALCKNLTLTSLNLYGNNLGSEGGKALAYALCKNSTLTSLNLGFNNLKLEGGKALANALCKNSTLKELNLRYNNLGTEVGKALADALCKNTSLTSLGLRYNELGSEVVKALADALCKNNTLKTLDLSYNKLGLTNFIIKFFKQSGCRALADALCKNSTLTFLNLSGNSLSFNLESNNPNLEIFQ
ncbi:hypothetical protein C2G38_1627099 [Gigaspora rosea]|uniref:Protein kinase domain-containing protein n=1 Tax=Gigaspora rosea TaxID=44941 RepID=A0A397W7E8_9GLOM|nr:hypothetical protein C2G38_1627099 [Gigaspora rosea]